MRSTPLFHVVLRHFDKAALVAVLAWLVAISSGFVPGLQPAELGTEAELSATLQEISDYMQTAQVPPAEAPAWSTSLNEQLSPDQVPGTRPFPEWVLHKRPGFLYRVQPPLPPVDIRHGAPVLGADASSRGQVSLTWEAPKLWRALLSGYEVWRKAEGGVWERLAEPDAMSTSLVDRRVMPRTRYTYRLVSLAVLDLEDPKVQEAGLTELPPGLDRAESDSTRPLRTRATLVVEVNSVTLRNPITEPDRTSSAYVFVHRWKGAGFVTKGFQVEEGGPIGDTDLVLGRLWSGTRVHRLGHAQRLNYAEIVWPDGRTEELNDRDPPAELNR